jgi:hypothetical protein
MSVPFADETQGVAAVVGAGAAAWDGIGCAVAATVAVGAGVVLGVAVALNAEDVVVGPALFCDAAVEPQAVTAAATRSVAKARSIGPS